MKEKIISARRGIGIIRFLSKNVMREVLDQMYKLYVRPHLDYGDIIYHKFDPEFTLEFTRKLESTQYTAVLTVSGACRGTNRNKLYEELDFEYLYHRRWHIRLTHFFKLRQSESPQYKIQLVRPPKNSIFNIRDIMGTKLLIRLRVEFSDLCCHKFRHNFDCSDPLCLCLTGIEHNEHFLLHCPRFATQHRDLFDLVSGLSNIEIMHLPSKELSNLLLYGHPNFTLVTNRAIVKSKQ